jgi:guanine deaminase
VGPVAQRRHSLARELHEQVFAWVTLGDERNLAECWVGGQRRYLRA